MSPSLKEQNEKIANYFFVACLLQILIFSSKIEKKNKIKKLSFRFNLHIYIFMYTVFSLITCSIYDRLELFSRREFFFCSIQQLINIIFRTDQPGFNEHSNLCYVRMDSIWSGEYFCNLKLKWNKILINKQKRYLINTILQNLK